MRVLTSEFAILFLAFFVLVCPTPESPCAVRYLSLHEGKETEIRIVFGYKDARPARFVADRYERISFSERLGGMGFQRDPEDADLYVLENNHHWRVRLVHSSVGPDDESNRKDSFQLWQSAYAAESFYKGLGQAPVVLYDGHSRGGGGPDFAPPRLDAKGNANLYWYRAQEPGFKRLIQELEAASHPTKVLGLFSCKSDDHFSKAILSAQKSISLISSEELLYHTDALENMEGLVRGLLGDYCKKKLDAAVEAESSGGKTKISGFLNLD